MGIGKTNAGGGGAALNFDVKRYATEEELLAATPKENTIGIISTTEMTGWIIDANQPENLTEGMVWISVGTYSTVEFNALKKNGLQVYPLKAKQMVSGALVDVEAMSYQDGEWVEWTKYLYNNGDQCADITGGWVANKNGSTTLGTYQLTPTLKSVCSGVNVAVAFSTKNMIDLTDCSSIKFTVNESIRADSKQYFYLAVSKVNNSDLNLAVYYDVTNGDTGKHSIDVSNLTGEYYVVIHNISLISGSATLEISEVEFE